MRSTNFIERTTRAILRGLERAMESEALAHAEGFLQSLDARAKVIGLLALIVAAVVAHRIVVVLAVLVFAVVLAMLSHVPLRTLAARVWLAVLIFSGVIVFPAMIITPGEVLVRLPLLSWAITVPGARSAMFVVARAETATTLSLLLVLCTPWPRLLKALRVLGLPLVVVAILGMTYRYIFLLLSTAGEMFDSRRSRMVGQLTGSERRRIAAATAGVLLSKSLDLGGDVYSAMQSRGFTGEIYLLSESSMRARDYLAAGALLAASVAAIWLGR